MFLQNNSSLSSTQIKHIKMSNMLGYFLSILYKRYIMVLPLKNKIK